MAWAVGEDLQNTPAMAKAAGVGGHVEWVSGSQVQGSWARRVGFCLHVGQG